MLLEWVVIAFLINFTAVTYWVPGGWTEYERCSWMARISTRARAHTHTQARMHTRAHAHTHHKHTRARTHTHPHTHTHTHPHTHHTHTHTHTHHTHTHTHPHTHIYIYTHTHTHTHTHRALLVRDSTQTLPAQTLNFAVAVVLESLVSSRLYFLATLKPALAIPRCSLPSNALRLSPFAATHTG